VPVAATTISRDEQLLGLGIARLSLFGVEFADFRALVDSKILIG